MNNVAAVIVTYNRKELLTKCIEKIENQTIKPDILVIDNASDDGTDQIFSQVPDNIKYFNTGANLGGAGGFSFGIKKAVETGYEYLWIMDDDTMPEPSALEELMKVAKSKDGDFGFLSSKALWKDNNICTMNVQKETKWKRMNDFNTRKEIQYASFVSLFVKADTVKEVGLPYKEFFIWADDWEYTRRISKNKKSYFLPESIVVHYCNSNVGADIITAPADRIDRFKYMYRNDVVMYRQDGIEGKMYLLIRNITHILKVLIKTDNKKQKLNIIFKATKEGRKFKPEVEYPNI